MGEVGGGAKYASKVMMLSSWFCMEMEMSKHFKESANVVDMVD